MRLSFCLMVFVYLFTKRELVSAQPVSGDPTSFVNVFLGSSGDHGQLSPAASYPFSMLSIGPQTYPFTHTGYEHLAKTFHGFTHSRFEGVGCQGSGGLILIKPFLGATVTERETPLQKVDESAVPGSYHVKFSNGIAAQFAVYKQSGIHHYTFPQAIKKGIYINLAHTFNNAFAEERHEVNGQIISGYIAAKTTCHVGTYRIYFALRLDQPVKWQSPLDGHELIAQLDGDASGMDIAVSLSSVSVEDALQNLSEEIWNNLARKSEADWAAQLQRIQVKGDNDRTKLFYSLLYRALQSPYIISSQDGHYRAIDGNLYQDSVTRYHGWAIWDNYKTQLPLLSLVYPERFGPIVKSIANLYPYGKQDFATQHEPSNSVRTEHAIVVLLDAYRKGYRVDFPLIIDSLKAEVDRLSVETPDKALETAYDAWALAEIFELLGDEEEAVHYRRKAGEYRSRWQQEFSDLSKPDIDRMSARRMYQGTIRQYRWSVPFDVSGLKEMIGGEDAFVRQLDDFFDNDYFNRANEPDLHVPAMYQASNAPWKSQYWMHKFAVDTVVNHYFNDNSRGIGSEITPIFKNQSAAFIRTMDDDAGAMSSWFVWAALGLYPACVGEPYYYLHLPLFEEIKLQLSTQATLVIKVKGYAANKRYVQRAVFNGQSLDRNWLSHEELKKGGELVFEASSEPNKAFGVDRPYVTQLDHTK